MCSGIKKRTSSAQNIWFLPRPRRSLEFLQTRITQHHLDINLVTMSQVSSILVFLGTFFVFGLADTNGLKPNIVLYLADDLGVGEVNQQNREWGVYDHDFNPAGGFSQDRAIHTPNLERLAKQGKRMMRSYTSSPVCGPARYALIRGLPVGRSPVRGNNMYKVGYDYPLDRGQATLLTLLKGEGYSNYFVGKWAVGDFRGSGAPWKQSVDRFIGFTTQTEAHRVFPYDLYSSNGDKVKLNRFAQNKRASPRKCHCNFGKNCRLDPYTGLKQNSRRCKNANEIFRKNAMIFITEHERKANNTNPFFLYWSSIVPHNGYYDPLKPARTKDVTSPVSTYGMYTHLAGKSMNFHRAGHMAAITHELDADVGVLMDKLQRLGIEENTLIIFMSDNGPHSNMGSDRSYSPSFFQASMGLKGLKRTVYEGGLRSPTIISWPGTIPSGTSSFVPHAGYDITLTIAGLLGLDEDAEALEPFQDIGAASIHEYLLVERDEQVVTPQSRSGFEVEICFSKLLQPTRGCDFAFFDMRDPSHLSKLVRDKYQFYLYDLSEDIYETRDIGSSDWNKLADAVTFADAFRESACRMAPEDCRPPSLPPSPSPTEAPTLPTSSPTEAPSASPIVPTRSPTRSPTTREPTSAPTKIPTRAPIVPTEQPTLAPGTTRAPTSAEDGFAGLELSGLSCTDGESRAVFDVDSMKECFSRCLQDEVCKFFEFSTDLFECRFFESSCEPTPRTVQPGVLLFDVNNVTATFGVQRQKCYWFDRNSKLFTRSVEENVAARACTKWCRETEGCRYFHYNSKVQKCYFFKENCRLQSKSGTRRWGRYWLYDVDDVVSF